MYHQIVLMTLHASWQWYLWFPDVFYFVACAWYYAVIIMLSISFLKDLFFFFQAVQSFFSSYIFCYYVNLFNQNLRLKCFYVFLFFIFFLYFFSCFYFNTLFSSFYLSNCLSLSEACFTRPLKNLLLSWVLFVHLLFSHIGY